MGLNFHGFILALLKLKITKILSKIMLNTSSKVWAIKLSGIIQSKTFEWNLLYVKIKYKNWQLKMPTFSDNIV